MSQSDFRPIIQRDKRAQTADLEELKNYMCETNADKQLEFCENCSGQGLCYTGKRAVQLLDAGVEDKPTPKVIISQSTQKENWKGIPGNNSSTVDKDLQKYIDTLNAKDPIQFLLDCGTSTEHAAKEWLRRRKLKYPDTYKKYVEDNPNHPLYSSSGASSVQEEIPVQEVAAKDTSIVDSKDEFTVTELLESIGEIAIDGRAEEEEDSFMETLPPATVVAQNVVKEGPVTTTTKMEVTIGNEPAKQPVPEKKIAKTAPSVPVVAVSSDTDISASDIEAAKRVFEKKWYDLEESKAKFLKQIEEHKQAIVKCQEEIDKISAMQDNITDNVLPLL